MVPDLRLNASRCASSGTGVASSSAAAVSGYRRETTHTPGGPLHGRHLTLPGIDDRGSLLTVRNPRRSLRVAVRPPSVPQCGAVQDPEDRSSQHEVQTMAQKLTAEA